MLQLGIQKANNVAYHFKDIKSHRNQSINSTKIAYHFLNAGIILGAGCAKTKYVVFLLV